MTEMPTALERIYRTRQKRVATQKAETNIADFLKAAAQSARIPRRKLSMALSDESRINVIAEIKRASPSRGVINAALDVSATVSQYKRSGAAAISVLTEEDSFKGSLGDLKAARTSSSLPLLRKDFIFDEFQVFESALAGADAILLIVALLNDANLAALHGLAVELGLQCLVEVHTRSELDRAAGYPIIGINNRNLHTMEVSLDVSRNLAEYADPGTILVSESGIKTLEEIKELKEYGFNGFLIGESLVGSVDPGASLRKFTA